jgi:hypothetical protein
MDFDEQHVAHWWQRPTSEVERAERSERWFWAKALAILACGAAVATAGVMQVRRSSTGIRTAYELVKINEATREQMEANRHLEAALTGMKSPEELQRLAQERYGMQQPTANQQVEVP